MTTTDEKTLERRLILMVRSSSALMELLDVVRRLNLSSWCIGAGVIRSLVWDRLHGFTTPSHYDDVDVVYYDDVTGPEHEAELLGRLLDLRPSVQWELANQALIHHWYLNRHSQVVPPLRSLVEGVATWPEYATCVGVTLNSDDSIEVIAPHGLEDLFQLRVRHNPIRADAGMFMERVMSKQFAERWPMLSIFSSVQAPPA
jgi:hypothetical protein